MLATSLFSPRGVAHGDHYKRTKEKNESRAIVRVRVRRRIVEIDIRRASLERVVPIATE